MKSFFSHAYTVLGSIAFGVVFFTTQSVLAQTYNIPYIVDGGGSTTMSVSLTANPSTVTLPANQTDLSWTITGSPLSCTASSSPTTSWSGSRSVSGGGPEPVTGLVAGSYVFTLTCDNGSQTVSDTALVIVQNAGPDLVSSTTTPSVAAVATPLTFSGTLTNQGSMDTGASFPYFFQVATAPMGGGTVTDLASSTTTALAQGASVVVNSPSYTFLNTGTHSVRLCADKSSAANPGVITETDESNNCGTWTRVTVSPAQTYTPSVTLSAGPTSVYSGGSSTLSWTSANVTSCTASANPATPVWTGSQSTSSSYPHVSTGALTVTTLFVLDCTGPYGNASSQATVVVNTSGPGVSVTLSALPDRISPGDTSTLSWSSANATSCAGQNFATGGATSGSVSVSPLVNTTYTIECTDGVSNATDQATIYLKRRFLFIEY
jgi:hypothetical protein